MMVSQSEFKVSQSFPMAMGIYQSGQDQAMSPKKGTDLFLLLLRSALPSQLDPPFDLLCNLINKASAPC
jgi:hypothetical protein